MSTAQRIGDCVIEPRNYSSVGALDNCRLVTGGRDKLCGFGTPVYTASEYLIQLCHLKQPEVDKLLM